MKPVFLVGCPRSGTTWVQMLLTQHPQVVTTQETHLFEGYLGPLRKAWERDRTNHRGIGVQAALTEEEFDEVCAEFARRVLTAMAKTAPGAEVVLEKTPAHVRHVELILKLLPDAFFIHLVRDPRAVVASLCAAGRSWGRSWASTDPVRNARMWASDVTAGRSISAPTQQHTTVKYEDLLGQSGASVLAELFHRMGLEADDGFCQRVLVDCSIDRLRSHSGALRAKSVIRGDPADFYRKGKADSWASELSARDVETIEYIAGDLMRDYGYVGTTKFAGRARKPWHLKLRENLDNLEWRGRRTVSLTFDKARRLM